MSDDQINQIPPHSIELEESILATCFLAGGEALSEVIDMVSPEYFYNKNNRTIFRAILDISHKAESADMITVLELLKSNDEFDKVGGITYLSYLLEQPPAVSISYSCGKLEQKFLLRRAIEFSYSMIKKCHRVQNDFDHVVDYMVESAHKISDGSKAGDPVVCMNDLAMIASDVYEERYKNKRIVTGIPSGISDLDAKTFGFHDGELTLIAARPAMGKTALALNMARKVGYQGIGSLIVSLEMPNIQLFDRLVTAEAKINGNNVRIGRFTPKEFEMVNDAIGRLYKLPIYIDDRGGLTFSEIRQTIRRQVKLHPEIRIIYIDHIQLVQGNDTNRNNELGKISYGLKTLAKDLKLPVVALCQLNRELERRNNPYRRPKLSDLRDSGNLEQDADNVIFIYRPIVYGDNLDPNNPDITVELNETDCELILAKQRQGTIGMTRCLFFDTTQRFESYTSLSPEQIYSSEGSND